MRISDKELDDAAKDLSALTGQDFHIRYFGQLPSLVLRNEQGVPRTVYTEPKKDLWKRIVSFQAGIEHGFALCGRKV